MIHIVSEDNRDLYAREFERLAGLVGDDARRQAALLAQAGAVHVLALDGDGTPEFACRLRPADGGCEIAERAPGLVAEGAATLLRPGVWERTRIYARPNLSGPEPEQIRRCGELRLAILEEARARDADTIVEVSPLPLLVQALTCGWRVKLLGLPGELEGEAVIAVSVDASAEAVGELRERLAAGPSRRLHLNAGDKPWAAPPKEVETFLEAAQQLDPARLEPLLIALRAALADDGEGDGES